MFKGKPLYKGEHFSRSQIGLPVHQNAFDPPPPGSPTWRRVSQDPESRCEIIFLTIREPSDTRHPARARQQSGRLSIRVRLWRLLDLDLPPHPESLRRRTL